MLCWWKKNEASSSVLSSLCLISKSLIRSLLFQVLYSFHNGTFAVGGSETNAILFSPRICWLKKTAKFSVLGWKHCSGCQHLQSSSVNAFVPKQLYLGDYGPLLLLGKAKSVSFTSGQQSGLWHFITGEGPNNGNNVNIFNVCHDEQIAKFCVSHSKIKLWV